MVKNKNGAKTGKKAKGLEPKETIEKENLIEIESSIEELRERAKKDKTVDFNKELRQILDHISDVKGEPRRPVTAYVEEKKNKKKPKAVVIEEDDDDEEEEDQEEEEEEEEEDPDKEVKELVNKRLTSCMLLALSFEAQESYPRDFYEKLADSNKLEEVSAPFTRDEVKLLNQMLKEKKKEAKKRVDEAVWNLE